MGSGMAVLGPHPVPSAGLVFIKSLVYSFFHSIIFIDHLLSVRPQGSEIGKSQDLPPGSTQSGGEGSCNVTCTVMEEALVSWSPEGL